LIAICLVNRFSKKKNRLSQNRFYVDTRQVLFDVEKMKKMLQSSKNQNGDWIQNGGEKISQNVENLIFMIWICCLKGSFSIYYN
jgi:hypothetical protein